MDEVAKIEEVLHEINLKSTKTGGHVLEEPLGKRTLYN